MATEKRLIDANKISYHNSGFPKGDGFDNGLDWAFREDIDKLPTVDAVEVVLCKDCTRCKKGYCVIRKDSWGATLLVGNHDFCSDGERRTDNA